MTRTASRARVRARRCAVQALYQWQLGGEEPDDVLERFRTQRDPAPIDLDYFHRLTREIPPRLEELETLLCRVLDREPGRLDPVEWAILLLGAYELRHCEDVPWRVVVNEAVDLAKMFGAEQGHRYVNAALDRLARDLRASEVEASGT